MQRLTFQDLRFNHWTSNIKSLGSLFFSLYVCPSAGMYVCLFQSMKTSLCLVSLCIFVFVLLCNHRVGVFLRYSTRKKSYDSQIWFWNCMSPFKFNQLLICGFQLLWSHFKSTKSTVWHTVVSGGGALGFKSWSPKRSSRLGQRGKITFGRYSSSARLR